MTPSVTQKHAFKNAGKLHFAKFTSALESSDNLYRTVLVRNATEYKGMASGESANENYAAKDRRRQLCFKLFKAD
jgi:hypothetical protein